MNNFSVNPVHWFEIPVLDMARATRFYELGFDLILGDPVNSELASMRFFPMEQDADGAPGALVKSESHRPSMAGTTVSFLVCSIDSVMERIVFAGGKAISPRIPFENSAFVAAFEDTEGNRVGLIELA